MAQIKIYGLRETLDNQKSQVSEAIHRAVTESLGLPFEKRFHRFFAMEEDDFCFLRPLETIFNLEISMFEGRTTDNQKQVIRALFHELGALGFAPHDVEITIFETPRHNSGAFAARAATN
jgi:hypothetical protein